MWVPRRGGDLGTWGQRGEPFVFTVNCVFLFCIMAAARRGNRSKSAALAQSKQEDDVYSELFDEIDTDSSGYLDFDELYTALVTHHNAPKQITPLAVLNMINEADIDGNSLIDVDEFVHIMKNAKKSTYWKTTSKSLWGAFNDAINGMADITESVLQPVHEAVAMHAHPNVSDGKLVSMSPGILIIIFASISSLITFPFWLIEPFFAWHRGKTLGSFYWGYQYVKRDGIKCNGVDIMKMSMLFYALIALPFVIKFGGQTMVVQPHMYINIEDYSFTISRVNIVACTTALLLCATNLFCFFYTPHHQNIPEFLCGNYAVVEGMKE